MEIKCNLYDEWIRAIRQEFSVIGFDHSQKESQECAILLQSWKRRTVTPQVRTVLK